MSNLLLAIVGTLVSMVAMVGFSVVTLEKLNGDKRPDDAGQPDGSA